MSPFPPNTDALTPFRSHDTPDRAPDHLADGTTDALRQDLIALLGPTAVRARVTDLLKYPAGSLICIWAPIERVKSAWCTRPTLRTNPSCMLSKSCRAHKRAGGAVGNRKP
jgi:hypothetical protein